MTRQDFLQIVSVYPSTRRGARSALALGKNWVTGTAGTAVAWGPRVTGIVSLVGQIGQGGVVNYGGQVGLSAAF